MKCPKCNEEIDDNASFCQSCGEKINSDATIYCPKCGEITKSDVSFCSNCGYNFTNGKSDSNITNRSTPFILGIIGSVLGLILSFFMMHARSYIAQNPMVTLLFLASAIGVIGTLYLKKDSKIGAYIMTVSAVLFFLFIFSGWIPCFFFGLGAFLVLKNK